ncbi:Unknown protein, partial [Striga hermonthica]
NLPTICFHCGRAGHSSHSCLYRPTAHEQDGYTRQVHEGEKESEDSTRPVGGRDESAYGPWVQVPQRARPMTSKRDKETYRSHTTRGLRPVGGSGSRFDLLAKIGSGQTNQVLEFGA